MRVGRLESHMVIADLEFDINVTYDSELGEYPAEFYIKMNFSSNSVQQTNFTLRWNGGDLLSSSFQSSYSGTTFASVRENFTGSFDVIFSGSEDRTIHYDVYSQLLTGQAQITSGTTSNDIILGGQAESILYGRGGDDYLYGSLGDDTLYGGDGNDVLNGGLRADVMVGGKGDDWYFVDQAGDFVAERENEGLDTVVILRNEDDFPSSSPYRMPDNIEVLRAGLADIIGNRLNNTITAEGLVRGGEGDDVINAGSTGKAYGEWGDDTLSGSFMRGHMGNDLYIYNNTNHVIDERVKYGGAGIDTVQASVSVNLGLVTKFQGDIENVTLAGTGDLRVDGNALANAIVGNSASNRLAGLDGDDIIYGGGGNDRIFGGNGKDSLTGGSGADIFYFATKLVAANVDRIIDFTHGEDTIALNNNVFAALQINGVLANSAFRSNTTGNAGDKYDRIIYESDTGKLFYDADGTGSKPGIHFATLNSHLDVRYSDFLIYG